MKQTDFLIRVEHPIAYTQESLTQILKRSGVDGLKVTILDSHSSNNSTDSEHYLPYIYYHYDT
jgi:hypothetical protein